MLSTPAVDEFGFYILTSPFGMIAEILVASFGVRVGASNDLLSVPAIVTPDLAAEIACWTGPERSIQRGRATHRVLHLRGGHG